MNTNIEDIKELDLLPVGNPYIAVPECTENEFKSVLKNRMTHCLTKLEHQINEAIKTPSGNIIAFKDGSYFSIPVYKHIEQAINSPMRTWDILTWQQICRELFENKDLYENSKDLFRAASEMLIVVTVAYD